MSELEESPKVLQMRCRNRIHRELHEQTASGFLFVMISWVLKSSKVSLASLWFIPLVPILKYFCNVKVDMSN